MNIFIYVYRGLGGGMLVSFPVSPGQVLTIDIGERGGTGPPSHGGGGASLGVYSGSGGGATIVTMKRGMVIVGGGGGSAAAAGDNKGFPGGSGG